MSFTDALCSAIQTKNLVQINYAGTAVPGVRVVEPHMVAYNTADHLALSAWYVSGASESKDGPGWADFLIAEIASVTVLPYQFNGPRPGYQPSGGKKFHSIQCAL
jgi:hypothetical protein